MNDFVQLRKSLPSDEHFLRDLFAATRPAPLNMEGFRPLADMQFFARQQSYEAHSRDSALIIETGGRSVGSLWLWRSDGEFRVADLAVVPEEQGRGVARAALRFAIGEAERAGVPLRLTVAVGNSRAIGLYRSAGFVTTGQNETDFEFELTPSQTR